MDKISVVRLSAAYLRTMSALEQAGGMVDAMSSAASSSSCLTSLQGFLIILSGDGSISFVSDHTDALLGLDPLDLMGNSVFDYVHLCDHQELHSILNPNGSENAGPECGFRQKFVRIKNTLTARGKRVNLSHATYRVCLVSPCLASIRLERLQTGKLALLQSF